MTQSPAVTVCNRGQDDHIPLVPQGPSVQNLAWMSNYMTQKKYLIVISLFIFLTIFSNNSYAAKANNYYKGTIKDIVANYNKITITLTISPSLDIILSIPKNSLLQTSLEVGLPWQSVFPGDGFSLLTNPDGAIYKAILYSYPYSGRIIFISNQKVTFQNGQQLLFSYKPFLKLNNKQLDNPVDFTIGQKVTYRVNTLSGEIGWMEGYAKNWKPDNDGLISSILFQPANITTKHNKVNIKVKGVPNTKITATILGIINNIHLKETSSGIYENTISISHGYYVKETKLILKTQKDDKIEEYLSSIPITIATRASSVLIESFPYNNAKIRVNKPFIYVNFKQIDIPLDVLTFKFIFDGIDITQATFRSQTFITYHPKNSLKQGWHHVYVKVVDLSGKQWQKSWRFFIS